MSILDKMRSGSDSTVMQLVLGAVFVSFVAVYAQPQGDNRGRTVATVNGTVIQDIPFNREMARRERYMGALSDEQRQQLAQVVKQDLIRDEVMLQEAHRLGIEVSAAEVERAIAYDPSFADESGVFSSQQFAKIVKGRGYERVDYEIFVRDRLLREKLAANVILAVDVSDADVRDAWKANETQIDVSWVRVGPARFEEDVDVSQAIVDAFVKDNAERIKTSYDTDYDRLYNQPERVVVSVIAITPDDTGLDASAPADLPAAEALAADLVARIGQGEDFAALATQYSKDPTAAAGGKRAPTALADFEPKASEALKPLAPGAVVTVVGEADVRVYRVEERLPARSLSLEEATPEVARKLIREDATPKLAAAFAEKVLAAWKSTGAPPTDLLDPKQIIVNTTGMYAPAKGLDRMGPPPDMLAKLASAPVGPLADVVEYEGIYWVAAVSARQEPDAAGFDAAKGSLRAGAVALRRMSLLEGWTADLVARAKIE